MSLRRMMMAGGGGGGGDFAAAVMADSPYAWWTMAQATGNMLDASGNGRHLVNNPADSFRGKPSLISGSGAGQCCQYRQPATTSGASWSTGIPGITGDIACGFSVIFNIDNLAAVGTHWLMHNGNTNVGGAQGMLIGVQSNGQVAMWTFSGGSWQQRAMAAPGAIAQGVTTMLGFYHDPVANTLSVYRNGTLLDAVAHGSGAGNGNSDWTVGGANRGSGGVFNGYIQHAMAFKALSDTAAARFLAHAQAAGLA